MLHVGLQVRKEIFKALLVLLALFTSTRFFLEEAATALRLRSARVTARYAPTLRPLVFSATASSVQEIS